LEPIPTENLWVQDVESELFTIIFESFAKSSPNKFTTCHWFILYWPSKGVMNRSSAATRTILTMSSKHVQVGLHAKWFQNHFLKTSVASKLLSPWSWSKLGIDPGNFSVTLMRDVKFYSLISHPKEFFTNFCSVWCLSSALCRGGSRGGGDRPP